MLWQPMAEGQLKPVCTGHCGPPSVIGPTHAGLLMVCGHPGAPCVQNIVHSNCCDGQSGPECVWQVVSCVQTIPGVGGQAGPKNVHCGLACVAQGANCVQTI